MKSRNFLIIPMLFTLLSFSACDWFDSDDDDRLSLSEAEALANAVETSEADLIGFWEVTRFIDDGDDKTPKVLGMRVEFAQNQVFRVRFQGADYTGTWKIVKNGRGLDIDIDVENDAVDELDEDDWLIMVRTNAELRIVDPDDDDDEDDWFYFERVDSL